MWDPHIGTYVCMHLKILSLYCGMLPVCEPSMPTKTNHEYVHTYNIIIVIHASIIEHSKCEMTRKWLSHKMKSRDDRN